MIFKCQRAAQIWTQQSQLGVETVINDAMVDGRSGSQVLEAIFQSLSVSFQCYDVSKMQEVIAIGALYIWWLRRRQTHGE
jgi:hypothetical protein